MPPMVLNDGKGPICITATEAVAKAPTSQLACVIARHLVSCNLRHGGVQYDRRTQH